MARLSDKDLESLVNQEPMDIDAITDEQAVDSDFGGDSDAEDERLDPKPQKLVVPSYSSPSIPSQLVVPGPSSSSILSLQHTFEEDDVSSSDFIPDSPSSSDDDGSESRHVKKRCFDRNREHDLIENEDNDQENQPPTDIQEQEFIWGKQANNPELYEEIVFTEKFGPKITPEWGI